MRVPVLSDLFDLLLPPQCSACSKIIKSGDFLCGACSAELERLRLPPQAVEMSGLPVLAPYEYGYPLNRTIPIAKNRDMPQLFRPLARAMYEVLIAADLGAYPEVVVPVPLYSARRRERGYDQACYLAELVAGYLDKPFLARALRRIRATPPQKRADRRKRIAALHEAFAPGPEGNRVEERRVLLVDDVVTTGATLEAAAQALFLKLPAGVMGIVSARTPAPKSSY